MGKKKEVFSWSTKAGIREDIRRIVPSWLLWYVRISIDRKVRPIDVEIYVKLYPWAWIWGGEKHRGFRKILNLRFAQFRGEHVTGWVEVE